MPQAMYANLLGDAGPLQRGMEHLLGAAAAVCTAILPLKEVFLGPVRFEVGAQLGEGTLGQGDVPVLLSLGPADMDLHVAAVDVRNFQCHQFTHTEAHAITKA